MLRHTKHDSAATTGYLHRKQGQTGPALQLKDFTNVTADSFKLKTSIAGETLK